MAETVLSLLQLTDCHLTADPQARFRDIDSDHHLRLVVDDALSLSTVFDRVLLTGDLVHHGPAAAYRRLLSIVDPLPGLKHWIPGNHDEPAAMRECRNQPCGMERIDLDAWTLLLLDSTAEPDGRGSGSLSEVSLQWLSAMLSETRDRHVLLVMHHNPVSTDSVWQDQIMLANAETLFDCLRGYKQVRGIICGHLHQQQALEQDGIPVWCSPATSVQFRPASHSFALETDMTRSGPGYCWYRLYADGRIEQHVRRLAPPHSLG